MSSFSFAISFFCALSLDKFSERRISNLISDRITLISSLLVWATVRLKKMANFQLNIKMHKVTWIPYVSCCAIDFTRSLFLSPPVRSVQWQTPLACFRYLTRVKCTESEGCQKNYMHKSILKQATSNRWLHTKTKTKISLKIARTRRKKKNLNNFVVIFLGASILFLLFRKKFGVVLMWGWRNLLSAESIRGEVLKRWWFQFYQEIILAWVFRTGISLKLCIFLTYVIRCLWVAFFSFSLSAQCFIPFDLSQIWQFNALPCILKRTATKW